MFSDKKKLIGFILGLIMFSITVTSLTYAYYSWQSANTDITFNINDQYFYCETDIDSSINNLSPVLDYKDGALYKFKVNNVANKNTTFSVTMNIESIDEVLKHESFKYKLMVDKTNGSNNCQTGASGCEEVASGNFSNVHVGNNTLVPSINLPNNSRYEYYFFMYIDGNMSNPSGMQSASMVSTLGVCDIYAEFDISVGDTNVTPLFKKVYEGENYPELPIPVRSNSVVTYNTNGGNSIANKSISYSFGGWYQEENKAQTTAYTANGNTVTTNTLVTKSINHTLYPRWQDTNGKHGTNSTSVSSDLCYKLPTPEKTGYQFDGWYQDSGLTKAVTAQTNEATAEKGYYSNDYYCPQKSHELYAKWTVVDYTITYKDCGNTNFSGNHTNGYPTKYNYGTGVTLDNPTRDGYTFGGYYSASTCSGNVVTSIGATETGNKTFYAKWNANSASVTIKKDGSNWTSSNPGINVALFSGTSSAYTYSTATVSTNKETVTWTTGVNGVTLAAGTYNIYISKDANHLDTLVDSGFDLVVTTDASKVVNYYTLTMTGTNVSSLKLNSTTVEDGGSVPVAGGVAQAINGTVGSGFTFSTWSKTSGNASFSAATSLSTNVTVSAASTINATAAASSTNKVTLTLKKDGSNCTNCNGYIVHISTSDSSDTASFTGTTARSATLAITGAMVPGTTYYVWVARDANHKTAGTNNANMVYSGVSFTGGTAAVPTNPINFYTLTMTGTNVGSLKLNDSSVTSGNSVLVVGGAKQAITGTVNSGYTFTTWSKTAGTATFDSATTLSTNVTVGAANTTINAAAGASSSNKVTITLKKDGNNCTNCSGYAVHISTSNSNDTASFSGSTGSAATLDITGAMVPGTMYYVWVARDANHKTAGTSNANMVYSGVSFTGAAAAVPTNPVNFYTLTMTGTNVGSLKLNGSDVTSGNSVLVVGGAKQAITGTASSGYAFTTWSTTTGTASFDAATSLSTNVTVSAASTINAAAGASSSNKVTIALKKDGSNCTNCSGYAVHISTSNSNDTASFTGSTGSAATLDITGAMTPGTNYYVWVARDANHKTAGTSNANMVYSGVSFIGAAAVTPTNPVNFYTLTMTGTNVGSLKLNDSSVTSGNSVLVVGGAKQAITGSVNSGYTFTTWSKTAGTVTFDSATTLSTNVTVSAASTINAAAGAASTNKVTITLKKDGSNCTSCSGYAVHISTSSSNDTATFSGSTGSSATLDITGAMVPGTMYYVWVGRDANHKTAGTNNANMVYSGVSFTGAAAATPTNPVNFYTLTMTGTNVGSLKLNGSDVTSGNSVLVVGGAKQAINGTVSSGYAFTTWSTTSGTATFDNATTLNTNVTVSAASTINAAADASSSNKVTITFKKDGSNCTSCSGYAVHISTNNSSDTASFTGSTSSSATLDITGAMVPGTTYYVWVARDANHKTAGTSNANMVYSGVSFTGAAAATPANPVNFYTLTMTGTNMSALKLNDTSITSGSSVVVVGGAKQAITGTAATDHSFSTWSKTAGTATFDSATTLSTNVTVSAANSAINATAVPNNYKNTTTGAFYDTLKNALANVQANQTIQVINGITETTAATLDSGKTGVTLDLNGETITLSSVNIVNSGGLTIISSQSGGTISGNASNVINNGTGSLTVSSGTITGTQSVISSTTGAVTINGGTINSTAASGNYDGIYKNGSTGTVTISSGSVTGYRSGVYNNGSSEINISGGTVSGTTQGIYSYSTGAVNITGGTVTGNTGIINRVNSNITINGTNAQVTGVAGNGITAVSGSVTVTNGEVKGSSSGINSTTGAITVNGGTVRSTAASGNYDGIYKNGASGAVTISSGSVTGYRSGIYNNGTSQVSIEGGTVTGTSQGIYSYSTGAVNVTGGIISGNAGIVNRVNSNITINGTNVQVKGLSGNGITSVSGTVTLTNGSITGTASGISATTGAININGGTVTSSATTGTNAAIYKNGASGIVTISAGAVTGYYGIYNNAAGPISITGGTVTGNGVNGIYNKTTGAISVTGGTVSGLSHGIHLAGAGSLTMGENSGTPNTTSPVIETIGTSNTYGVYVGNASATYNFYDGKVTSDSGAGKSIYLSSASFMINVPDGYDVVKTTTGSTETAILGTGSNYKNTSTNKEYMYLKRALYEVSTGQTIQVLNGITEVDAATLAADKTVTLDLKGKTVTLSSVNITNNGNLTVVSSTSGGVITGTSSNVINTAAGSLTVTSGTITGTQSVISASTGTVLINGGTVNSTATTGNYDGIYVSGAGNVTVSSGSVTGYRGGIYNNSSATISVDGGRVVGTSQAIYNNTGTVAVSNGEVIGTTQAIYNNSASGTINITGGEVTGNKGIYNKTTGTITINGTNAQVTGATGLGIDGITGNITVTKGTVTGKTHGISVTTGTVTVNGGTVTSNAASGTNAGIYKNGATGLVTISSGTVSGLYGIYNNVAGPISITGGTITGTTQNGIYNKTTGSIEITGGKVTGVGHGIHMAGAGFLTMGVDDGNTPGITSPIIETTGTSSKNGVYFGNASATYNFYDGKVTSASGRGKAISFGGTINTPTNYGVAQYMDGTVEVAILGRLYTVTLTTGTGVDSLTGSGWTGSPGTTISKSLAEKTELVLSTITVTSTSGYSGANWTKTSGSGSLSNDGVFTVGAGNATLNVTSPVSNSNKVTLTLKKDGNNCTNCNGYIVHISASSSSDTALLTATTPSSATLAISGAMTPGTTYYVWVARDANHKTAGTNNANMVYSGVSFTGGTAVTPTNPVNFYTLKMTGTNMSALKLNDTAVTNGNSVVVVGGAKQAITGTVNNGYAFSTWSTTAGTASFDSATTLSTNVTVSAASTINAATGPSPTNKVTLTLKKDGSNCTNCSGYAVHISTSNSNDTASFSGSTGSAATLDITGAMTPGTNYYVWLARDANHKTAGTNNANMVYSGVSFTGGTAAVPTNPINFYTLTMTGTNVGSLKLNDSSVTSGNSVLVVGGAKQAITGTVNSGYTFTTWSKTAGTATFDAATSISTNVTVSAANTTINAAASAASTNKVTITFKKDGSNCTSCSGYAVHISTSNSSDTASFSSSTGSAATLDISGAMTPGTMYYVWVARDANHKTAGTNNANMVYSGVSFTGAAAATPTNPVNFYTLTMTGTNVGSLKLNGSDVTSGSSVLVVGGAKQEITGTVSSGYTFTTWSKTAGTATFDAATSISTKVTVSAANTTINAAASAASTNKVTITFKKDGSNCTSCSGYAVHISTSNSSDTASFSSSTGSAATLDISGAMTPGTMYYVWVARDANHKTAGTNNENMVYSGVSFTGATAAVPTNPVNFYTLTMTGTNMNTLKLNGSDVTNGGSVLVVGGAKQAISGTASSGYAFTTWSTTTGTATFDAATTLGTNVTVGAASTINAATGPNSSNKVTLTLKKDGNNCTSCSGYAVHISTNSSSDTASFTGSTGSAATLDITGAMVPGTTYYVWVARDANHKTAGTNNVNMVYSGVSFTGAATATAADPINFYTLTMTGTNVSSLKLNGTAVNSGSSVVAVGGVNQTITGTVANTYTFSTWSATTGTVTFDEVTSLTTYIIISSASTINAAATPNTYEIFYRDCGDIGFSGEHENNYSDDYVYGVGATLDHPTKEGYTFAGYYTSSACSGTAVTSVGNSESGNKTFYAKWNLIVARLTFNSDGGTISTNISSYAVVYNQPDLYDSELIGDDVRDDNQSYWDGFNLGDHPVASKQGYNFEGWYTESGSDGILVLDNNGELTGTAVEGYTTSDSWVLTQNKTLYAHYTLINYGINYTLNGGVADTSCGSNVNPSSVSYNDDVMICNPTKVVRVAGNSNGTDATDIVNASSFPQQQFSGWTSTTIGNTAKYGATLNSLANWSGTLTTNEYFKFLSNTGSSVNMVANWTPVAVHLPTFNNPGYTCNWYTDQTGGTLMGGSGATWTPSANIYEPNNEDQYVDVTAYLQCTPNDYTVTYNANGGTLPLNSNFMDAPTNNNSLPSTYRELDFIESTGTQYINTGIKFNSNVDKFELTYQVSNALGNYFIAGSGWQETGKLWVYSYKAGNTFSVYITDTSGTQRTFTGIPGPDVLKHTVTYDAKKLYVDGTLKTDGSSYTFGETPYNFSLFNAVNSTGYYAKTRIYSFKMWKSGQLVRNMVPCQRISDDVLGLYDKVGGTFYTNDGTGTFIRGMEKQTKQKTFGDDYGELPIPTRTDYTFNGWYLESTFVHKVTDTTEITTSGNHTLYAKWTHVFTLNANGGTLPLSEDLTDLPSNTNTIPSTFRVLDFIEATGTQYIQPAYKPQANTGVEIVYQFSDLTQQQRLFGVGNDTYYQMYINSANNWAYAYITASAGNWINTGIAVDKNKHTFKFNYPNGYYSIDGGSNTAMSGTVTAPTSYNLTLFAVNGSGTLNYYAKMRLYSFKIYEGTTLVRNFVPCQSISSGKIGLYETSTGTFYINPGSGEFIRGMEKQKMVVENGEEYGELPVPERTGYSFDGWYTAASGGTQITSSSTVSDANGYTLYAHWISDASTLIINPNGGTFSGTTSNTTVSGNVNEQYKVANNPTRAGYVFTGWTFSGGGTYTRYDTSVSASSTTTFNYNASNSTLPTAYNNSGGGTVTNSMVADSTATGGYALRVVTNGTASPGAGGVYVDSALPTTADRINVIQVKAKIPTGYNLALGGISHQYTGIGSNYIYDTNAGTGGWVTYNLVLFMGHTGKFDAHLYLYVSGTNNTSVTWYINSISVKSYTQAAFKSVYKFAANNGTLTARWGTGGSRITFNTNGGTFNTTYVKSWSNGYFDASSTAASRPYSYLGTSYATAPASTDYNFTPDSRVTSRTGYTFAGWYTATSGGTKVFNVNGTLPASVSGYSDSSSRWIKYDANATLYARWTANTYTLTYNNNSGSGCTSKTGTYGSTWGSLCTPTRLGFKFNGWYTATSGGTQVTASTTVSGNQTVYARWGNYVSDGYYYVAPTASTGFSLNVENAYVDNSTNVQIYTSSTSVVTTKAAMIELKNNGDGTITMLNQHSRKAIDIKSATMANSTNVQIYTSNNSCAQKWYMVPATTTGGASGYLLKSSCNQSYGLDISGGTFENNRNVQLYTSNGSNAQIWTFQSKTTYTNQTYTIAYNGNGNTGGSTASQTGIVWKNEVTLRSNGFTKAGYSFKNWNTATGGGGITYAAGGTYAGLTNASGGTITLYAQWNHTATTMYPKTRANCRTSKSTSASVDFVLQCGQTVEVDNYDSSTGQPTSGSWYHVVALNSTAKNCYISYNSGNSIRTPKPSNCD